MGEAKFKETMIKESLRTKLESLRNRTESAMRGKKSTKRTKKAKICDAMKRTNGYRSRIFLDCATEPSVQEKIEKLKILSKSLHSCDWRTQLEAASELRKLVSIETDPPLQEVIDSGAVPILINLLEGSDKHEVQFECCWALTNLVSGTTKHTNSVLEYGAAPTLVNILNAPGVNLDVKEQAVWALGNIGGDGSTCRDMLLSLDVMATLLTIVNPRKKWKRKEGRRPPLRHQETMSLSMRRNIIWTISNLCRGKPQPSFHLVASAIPVIASLLKVDDDEVLTDACWALSYLSDDHSENNIYIQSVIDAGVVDDLVRLLNHHNLTVQNPALRAVGNIVTGTDTQTSVVVAAGALPVLKSLMLNESKASIRKEVVWTLSNITAGTPAHIQAVIDEGIIVHLLDMLDSVSFDICKEAVWAISNATGGATVEQIQYLVNLGAIESLCHLLTPKYTNSERLYDVTLSGIENILKLGLPEYSLRVERCGGLDKIEALQTHPNDAVYEKAYTILTSYFEVETVEEFTFPT